MVNHVSLRGPALLEFQWHCVMSVFKTHKTRALSRHDFACRPLTSPAATGTVEAFAAGGTTGLVYQILLQQTVDSIPGSSDYRQPPAKRIQRFLGSPVFRISFLGAAILCGLQVRAPASVSCSVAAVMQLSICRPSLGMHSSMRLRCLFESGWQRLCALIWTSPGPYEPLIRSAFHS